MSANMVANLKLAIENKNVKSVTGWTDSTAFLHWLKKRRKHKRFIGKRVDKIREKDFIKWYYVPTKQNPAQIGSKENLISSIPNFWLKGPAWLSDIKKWEDQPRIEAIVESESEAKLIKEILVTNTANNEGCL